MLRGVFFLKLHAAMKRLGLPFPLYPKRSHDIVEEGSIALFNKGGFYRKLSYDGEILLGEMVCEEVGRAHV